MRSMLCVAVATADDVLAKKIARAMPQSEMRIVRLPSINPRAPSPASTDFDLIAMDYSNHRIDEVASSYLQRCLSKSTPSIAIVSDGHVDLAVQLLNAGVDRCLPVSFDEDHFRAVVRALTRRSQGLASSVSAYGALSFHHATKRTCIHGVEVELTARETQVLEVLLRRVGQLISKETFIEAMGPDSIDINSSAVEVYIYRLRKKIPHDVLPIRNIKRCGYYLRRFTPALSSV
ncbi:MAG: response regulator transcription factor [Limnohabitans sp.]